MGNLQKVVYLSESQAQELFTNNTITVDGVTVNYSADDLYLTPDDSGSFVKKTGDTMTGALVLSADPTTNLGAATKQYVDAAVAGGGSSNYVLKTGDTMTGALKAKGLRTYVSDTNGNASLNFGETADSTRLGRITMNTTTNIMEFDEGNERYLLPAPTASSETSYNIVTTNGSYTLGGQLNIPGINSYAATWPGYGFALSSDPTTALVSLNYDQSEKRFTFVSNANDGTGTTEAFSLPQETLTDGNWHGYAILTSKTPVTVAQGGTGATTAANALTNLGAVAKSGDTMTGNLNINSDTASLNVGSTNGGAGVRIFRDSEGGNIALWSPNGTGWQMDAFNNIAFRLYYNAGSPSWSFVNTGNFQIEGAQAPYITLKSNVADIKSTTNNLSSTIYPAIIWQDKNGITTCRLENGLAADGSSSFYIYTQNYNSSGTASGLRGLKYTISNANVGTWSVSDAAAFRTALGLGSNATSSTAYLPLAGGTMTGQLVLSSSGYKTSSTNGYYTNAYGNFIHADTTTTSSWNIQKNDGTAVFTINFESGNTTMPGQLLLSKTTDISGTASSEGALVIGTKTGSHLAFDYDEIMAKASATTVGPLHLNYDGGNIIMGVNNTSYYVQIRSTAAATSTTTGALRVGGGIGVSGSIFTGGGITSTGDITMNKTNPTIYLNASSKVFGLIRTDSTQNRIIFREYTTAGDTSKGEDYWLPTPTKTSGVGGYMILTSKHLYYAASLPSSGTDGDFCFVPV